MANLKKSDIDSLLSEVEEALTAALKEEQEKLSKAHPGEDTSAEKPADTSETSPKKEPEASTSPPPGDGDADDAAPAPDASASVSPEASGPADASAPPADGSAPADPAADASQDPQALQDEYSKLGATDPEALKNHYLACKAALFALMGAGADPTAAPAGAPAPVAPAAPPVASPSPDAPPAMKSEKSAGGMPTTTEAANGGQGMMKSEKEEIKGLTEKLAKQEEAMASLLTVVTSMVETPVRKGITSIDYMAKTEDDKPSNDLSKLPKTEVKALLRRASEKPLRKSDRDLITAFDLGHIGVEKIAHLIK